MARGWETAAVPLPADPDGWGLVVPVKRLAVAKSRLDAYGDDGRQRLALAFAQDVVRAAVRCAAVRRVLVITDDARAAAALSALGAEVHADRPDAGLNPALEHGVQQLRDRDPRLGVATVSSDLPALRSIDLAAALAATQGRAFVADSAGSGTTLLAAAHGVPLRPAYGPGSAALHRASGARELPGAAGLRRDVDTPDDLAAAALLGLGLHTAAVLAELAPAAIRPRSPRQGTMQR